MIRQPITDKQRFLIDKIIEVVDVDEDIELIPTYTKQEAYNFIQKYMDIYLEALCRMEEGVEPDAHEKRD